MTYIVLTLAMIYGAFSLWFGWCCLRSYRSWGPDQTTRDLLFGSLGCGVFALFFLWLGL